MAGGATKSEIVFLRAFALEQLDRHHEAIIDYLSLPDGRNDYYGKRATQRLLALSANAKAGRLIQARGAALRSEAEKLILAGKMDEGRRAAQNAATVAAELTPAEVVGENENDAGRARVLRHGCSLAGHVKASIVACELRFVAVSSKTGSSVATRI